MMKVIDKAFLQDFSAKAAASERKRTHFNLHESLEDDINRLCIAMTPESYIRPHRHFLPMGKNELFILLAGKGKVLIFEEDGTVKEIYHMAPGQVSAIEIPCDTWHTFISEQNDCAAMEIKHGPYIPTSEEDFAPWAPKEKDLDAQRTLAWFHTAKKGDRFQKSN